MFRWKRKFCLGLILFLVVVSMLTTLTTPPIASACGGFFCTNSPVDQTAERIIFAVNKDDSTITAVVGISYTGTASEFSWVVPVPSPPKLDVAETKSLDALSTATNLEFIVPKAPCPLPLAAAGGDPGGGFLQTGQVGPFDYAIIKNEKTDEMIAWLRENGYQITKEMEPLIVVYVKEGMYFLAMKLKRGADVLEIKPVVMTYNSTKPMIPLRLTAVAAVEDLQVVVWILGDAQYVPENYGHPKVDFGRMRNGFQPVQESGLTYTTLVTYKAEQKRFQEEYKGLAFITEYAQPTTKLLSTAPISEADKVDPIVMGLLKKYPYITRLRAQMSPKEMTVDPTFITDSKAPDVSNRIELEKYVDARTFWRCQ
jgi:hypothetical protein